MTNQEKIDQVVKRAQELGWMKAWKYDGFFRIVFTNRKDFEYLNFVRDGNTLHQSISDIVYSTDLCEFVFKKYCKICGRTLPVDHQIRMITMSEEERITFLYEHIQIRKEETEEAHGGTTNNACAAQIEKYAAATPCCSCYNHECEEKKDEPKLSYGVIDTLARMDMQGRILCRCPDCDMEYGKKLWASSLFGGPVDNYPAGALGASLTEENIAKGVRMLMEQKRAGVYHAGDNLVEKINELSGIVNAQADKLDRVENDCKINRN